VFRVGFCFFVWFFLCFLFCSIFFTHSVFTTPTRSVHVLLQRFSTLLHVLTLFDDLLTLFDSLSLLSVFLTRFIPFLFTHSLLCVLKTTAFPLFCLLFFVLTTTALLFFCFTLSVLNRVFTLFCLLPSV